MSEQLFDKCLEAAVSRGVDIAAPYKPWLNVDLMQTLLLDVHDALGCSWLLATVLACIGIRIISLPMSVASFKAGREKALIQPEFTELTEKQRSLSMSQDTEKSNEVAKKIQAFTQKHGRFFMLKGTGNLICFQMPLYLTAFASMRGLAGHPHLFPGFAMEAPLWLESLALPDPYAILPLLTAAMMITNAELFGSIDTEIATTTTSTSSSSNVFGQNTFQKYQKQIMWFTSLIFVPMTWNFPAGVFVFMSTNLLSSSLQNRLMRLPAVERFLEIPPPADRAKAADAAAAKAPLALLPLGETLLRAGVVKDKRLFGTPAPVSRAAAAPASGTSQLLLPAGGAWSQPQRIAAGSSAASGSAAGAFGAAGSPRPQVWRDRGPRGGPVEQPPTHGAAPFQPSARYEVQRVRPAPLPAAAGAAAVAA